MLARLSSASLRGLDAEAVDVEVDLSKPKIRYAN